MKKRIISLILVFVMVFALIPSLSIGASAAETGAGPKKIEGGQRDFKWPVQGQYNIQSCFLDPDAVYITHERTKYHYALDIYAAEGTNVVAAYDGIVVAAVSPKDNYGDGFGKYVVIKHNYKKADGSTITLYSKYNHLSYVSVSNNQSVKAGSVIGKVGKTGFVYGTHLDFQILMNTYTNYMSNSIDPYTNNLLELPSSIYKTASTDCCGSYIKYIKSLYSTPIVKDYVSECGGVKDTSAKVTTTAECAIWSEPRSTGTSKSTSSYSKGTPVKVIGYLTNKAGNIWYKTDGGKWIWSGNAKFSSYVPTIDWSGMQYPNTHYDKLPSFKMYGNITTSHTKIGTVSAWVVSSNGNKYFTNATQTVNGTSYNLRASTVDNRLVFGDLPSGNYSIHVTASEVINFPGQKSYSKTSDIVDAAFSIGASSKKIEDCSSPVISSTDIAGGKRVSIKKGSSSDAIEYIITNSSGVTVTSGMANGTYDCLGTGIWSITAYEHRAGYNSVKKTQTVSVSAVATPVTSYDQTAAGTIVTIKSGTSGASIYYTTSGNNPYVGNSDTKLYNGQLVLGNEDVTVKAYAVKKGYADSSVSSQFIEAIVPATPVVKVASGSKSPIGDVATFNWAADKKAGHYDITLYKNDEVIKQESITENSYSFIPETAGRYEIKVTGVNDLGSGETSKIVGFDAMNPCTVRFVDWDGTLISEQTVKYGGSAVKPASPSRRGYTFDGWGNVGYSRVTEDIELQAEYEINTYTVSFYSATGALLSKQTITFDEAATPPTPPAPAIGYIFAGWATTSVSDTSSNCDYNHVDADMSLTAVYAWENEDLPVVAQIDSAVRSAATNNYKIGVSLYNAPKDNTTAILRVSLKASNGKLLMTSRCTVELLEGGNGSTTVTMKYSGEASYAEVIVIGFDGDEKTGGTYSTAVQSPITDEADWVWGPWNEWQTEVPEKTNNTDTEAQNQYRMRTKEYMKSGNSSVSGWTQYDKTVTYGSWSSFGDKKITASSTVDVNTRQVQVTPASTTYTYGAYFSSNSSKPYAWTHFCPTCANWSYGGTWTYKTHTQSTRASVSSLGQSCGHKGYFGSQYRASDGYLYYYETINNTPATYKTQYQSRSITTTYSFWKWGDWSEWIDCDSKFDATSTNDTQYDTRTLYRTRDKVYGQTGDLEDASGNTYTISGKLTLDKDFSGKIATVFVYNSKNTDPNVDQIQYIGQITIGEDNSYNFSFVPKTEPTSETGDFMVALAFEGGTELLNIDIIKAPAPEYKVVYLDSDGTVISEQMVVSGENAVPPEAPSHEGMKFTTWSASSVNVRSDRIIVAQYDTASVVVAFADWANETVTIQNYNVGDVIIPPEAPVAEGKTFIGWDKISDEDLIATEDMVINAVYEDSEYTVTFLDADGEAYDVQKVKYGKSAQPPMAPDTGDMAFIGWSDENPWWEVTDDMTVAPVLEYKDTVAAPTYDIVDENGTIYVTMESATEGAEIYYTYDGTDPTESGEICQGTVEIPTTILDVTPNYNENGEYVNTTITYEIDVFAVATAENMNNSETVNIHYNGIYVSDPEEQGMIDFADISLDNAEANKDCTADIGMHISKCEAVTGWTAEFAFDTDTLSLADVVANNDYEADFEITGTDTGATVVYTPGNVLTEDEAEFTLKFNVADNAEPGEYSVSVNEENSEVLNVSGDSLPVTHSKGIVTVRDFKVLSIKNNPENAFGLPEETVEFNVEAYGEGLSYCWQLSKDGGETWSNTSLDGYNTDTLSVVVKEYRAGYMYRCVVTDADGNKVTSEAATLCLKPFEGIIVKQPEDFAGNSRERTCFEVVAEGENLTYQWYYSNDGGNKWGKSSSQGSTSSVFEPMLYADTSGRLFKCEITDQYGMKVYSDVVKMYIDYSEIEITEQPVSYTGKANDLAQFTVKANATNLEYQWQVSMDGGETWSNSENEGCNSEILNVRLYAYRDGYMYRCKLTSGSTFFEDNCNIVYSDVVTINKIAQTVKIESHPENAYCAAGETAVFSVDADGEGLTYQWQYSTTGGETWGNSGMTGANTDTLNVKATAARNGQMYRCKVTDESGSYEISGIATLHVGEKPVIISQPESYIGPENSNAVFTVNATGKGLSYQWYYRTSENAGWAKSGQADAKTDTFTVAVKGYRDGYQYMCEITNAEGMKISTDIVTLEIGELAHVHNFGDWQTTKEATCTEDGEERCYCESCDKYQSRIISATGHEECSTVTENSVSVTCETNGSYDTVIYCKNCGEELSRETTVIEAHGHDYKSTVTSEKACTTDGVITYTCENCGNTYDEITVADGHTVVVDEAVAATCTNTGLTEGSHCSTCGEVITEQEIVPKLDHSYVDGYCEICGVAEGDAIIASGTCEDNISWELYDSGLLRVFPTELESEAIIIDFEGNSSGPWSDFKDKIISVDIASGITAIGDYAFYGCTKLESVNIPEGVEKIGVCAFYNCTLLKNVIIPDTITNIDTSAFSGCKSIAAIELPENLTYLGSNAFYGCSNLKSIAIPENVTYLGKYSFAHCTSLTNAEVKANVPSISEHMFFKCSKLKEVSLPASITNIEPYVFQACTSLTDVYYSGPEMSWTKIKIAKYNEPLSKAEIHYNKEATIAASGTCEGNISWSVDVNGLLRIYPTDINKSGSIPDFESLLSNSAPWYDYRNDIQTVVIENGITGIGAYSMYNCANLVSVTLPDSLESVGSYAFYLCKQLQSIELPDGVRSIGESAFCYCSALKEFVIPDGVESIEAYTFKKCENLEQIVIPDSVKTIGKYAFDTCSALTEVVGAENVESIGSYAFYGCTKLEAAPIHEKLSSIGGNAFYNCDALTEIALPAGTTEIGTRAFSSCDSLTTVTIPEGITSMGKYAFNSCISLSVVNLPEGITEIGEGIFCCCTELSAIKIPVSVTKIGNDAFANCAKLSDIYYDGSEYEWKSIDIGSGNDALTNANIHCNTDEGIAASGTLATNIAWAISNDGVLSIRPENQNTEAQISDSDYRSPWEQYAKQIDSIVIESGVNRIGKHAFYRLKNVESVEIPDTIDVIGIESFRGCTKLQAVFIPDSVKTIGPYAFADCASLETVKLSENVTIIGDGVFLGCVGLNSITIPESVTCISEATFNGCTNLKSVVIPENVTVIEYCAFEDCSSLESIVIPDGVYEIGWDAFCRCSGLKSVTLPQNITYLKSGVFAGCSSLESINVPESVMKIVGSAFSGCTNLREITIPNSVTRINANAFSGCTGLEDVYYHGTETEWTEIVTPDGNESLANATIHYTEHNYLDGVCQICGKQEGITIINKGECGDNLTWTLEKNGKLTISGTGNMTEYGYNLTGGSMTNYTKAPWGSDRKLIKSVVIEPGVTSIARYAFMDCTNLNSVSIPDTIVAIPVGLFEYCTSLKEIDLPNSITTIGQGFRSSGIKEIVIPSGETSIALEAFYNCSSLTKVTIPSSVTSIGYEAFKNCSSLTSAVFCGNAPTCNSNLFDDCAPEFKILAPDNDDSWKGEAYDAETQTWNGYPIEFYHPDVASGN